MLRTSKVTFTASAVTLACLAGALYASPVVIAETMGREVTAYSPMNHQVFMQQREQTTLHATTDATTAGTETFLPESRTQQAPESDVAPASETTGESSRSASEESAATVQQTDGEQTTGGPSQEPTSRITTEIPQVEASLPESQDADQAESATSPGEATASDDATSTPDADESVPDDLDSPDSITVIVNKLRALPADYTPDDLVELSSDFTEGSQQLRQEAAEEAEAMFAAAQEDNIALQAISSFRSYDYQQELYDSYLEQYGDGHTNGMSARPGHSEHQTGLALDVDSADGEHTLQTSFGQTEAGQWLADHAHEHGFVIRYPDGAQDITGFQYEPWHLRYFGEQYSTQIFENSGIAEEQFGLEIASDYEE